MDYTGQVFEFYDSDLKEVTCLALALAPTGAEGMQHEMLLLLPAPGMFNREATRLALYLQSSNWKPLGYWHSRRMRNAIPAGSLRKRKRVD